MTPAASGAFVAAPEVTAETGARVVVAAHSVSAMCGCKGAGTAHLHSSKSAADMRASKSAADMTATEAATHVATPTAEAPSHMAATTTTAAMATTTAAVATAAAAPARQGIS
jgi:hypothetical protein